jgi:predicted TIM-barrel fold metal-dependent hydrolase
MGYGLALIVLVAIVAAVVLHPLRAGAAPDRTEDERRATLEAAKEAKYREIRDAQLDHQMGKLSDADWRATDRELRAHAIEILKAIDDLPPEPAELGAEPERR